MLILHSPPKDEKLYTDYKVTVNGISAKLPLCRVSAMPYNTAWPGYQRPLDQTEEAAFLSFESDEAVTLTVTYKNAPDEVLVRPLSKGVNASIDGNTATVTLSQSGAYTVEADGFHHALHVFFNPVKDFEKYTVGAKNILHYPAGVHRVGKVELVSDTTVILDSGAYVYGSFFAVCAQNVTVCGYGVIDGSEEKRETVNDLLPLDYYANIPADREAILSLIEKNHVLDGIVRFYNCKNIRLEGVIMRDCSTFACIPARCEDVTIENVKAVGMWRYNSDGTDLFNCSRAVIRNCFLRHFDDCIVLKGICGWDDHDMTDILIENCVTWCDWGRNLEIGAETNAPKFKNIIFRNSDCIHGSSICLDIHHHNRAEISDVTFEDIRVEYTRHQLPDTYQHDMNAPFPAFETTRHPLLMAIPIYNMGLFSKDGKHGCVHDVKFKNIQILTDSPDLPVPESMFIGLDEAHTVSRVKVENVTFNGKHLHGSELRIHRNEFTHDIELD